MPVYAYKAADSSGKIVQDVLEAPDEKGVAARLHEMDCIPIRIQLSRKRRAGLDADVLAQLRAFFNRAGSKDVLLFTQDLSSLLEAGLPVDRALHILIDVAENDNFKTVVSGILKNVQGGGYLSDALSKFPNVFSHFYINMIKAGETGGVLEDVLKRLGIFLESSQDLKDYIKSALVYPIFLVCIGGISIIILMTFVIPKFSIIFADMGQSIPLTTRMLLTFSQFLSDYWWAVIGVAALGFFLLRRYLKTDAGRLKRDQYQMRLPFSGELVKKIEVARFARTLGTLIRSGVPILQALRLVKDIIRNQVVAGSLDRISDRVKEGERLSRPLEETGIFPSLAIQMITVGEETGRLDEMLLRVADNYEKNVRNIIKRLVSLLEPAMILFMGLVVGFIVISMLLAIFSMNDMPF